jgi:hypothetical protein
MDDVGIAKIIILASAPRKAFDDAVALFRPYPERFEVWCGIILETEDEHFYADALGGYHWPLHGFGLRDEVLRKVYAENARRILNQAKSP